MVDNEPKAGTIGHVPNKPKTPVSAFRLPLDLKARAQAKGKERREDLTAVVVRGLEWYVDPAWDAAQARAERDGDNLSEIIRNAIKAYGQEEEDKGK